MLPAFARCTVRISGPSRPCSSNICANGSAAPQRYSAERGHPRLRMRHAAFPIGVAERNAWLACMGAALDETGVEPVLRDELMQAFSRLADWLRNTGR